MVDLKSEHVTIPYNNALHCTAPYTNLRRFLVTHAIFGVHAERHPSNMSVNLVHTVLHLPAPSYLHLYLPVIYTEGIRAVTCPKVSLLRPSLIVSSCIV